MCGILGTIPSTEEGRFKEALDKLYHRGPDSFGIITIDKDITLGHRRLAIIDLSNSANQPMFDESGRYCIVYNGEIYNYLELKNVLISLGYQFRTTSDTEVLLYSFIEWGENCVFKFNGMWAFAIWDNKEKQLFLSRDRFGKKPLFYSFVDGKFIFASEMKAIFPFLKEIRPSREFKWIKQNIFSYEGTELCLVEGIKRLPAGHNAYFRNGELKIKRYWNTLDWLIEPPMNYEKQVEMFRELFFDACKLRLRSDVPIATALSGGLDSSSVISGIVNVSSKKPTAFTVTFPGTPLDETEYASRLAKYLGVDHICVEIDPIKNWDKIYHYLYMFEELYITPPIPMIAVYKEMNSNKIKVTIDGHGADELFSGYGHILEALWDIKSNPKKILDILDTYTDTMKHNSNQFKKANKMKIITKYFLKKIIKQILGKDIASRDKLHKNFKKLDNLSKNLYVIFHETILPTLLRNYDRYSMINSVEIRMPFMDYRIVSFVFSLSYESKIGGGYTKKLLRDAMAPFMPPEIVWRKTKIGFNSPIVNWMQNDLKDWFSNIVHEKSFLESELVDNPKLLQKHVMEIVNRRINDFHFAERCWTELTPYLWEEAVIKQKGVL